MALHGEIKVDERIIGRWWARRTEALKERTSPYDVPIHTYECGYMREVDHRQVRFNLTHRYDDGGMVLAQRVLEKAVRELGREGE